MPEVKLVDMKKEIRSGNKILSKALIEAMNECLNRNEQIILFLNIENK